MIKVYVERRLEFLHRRLQTIEVLQCYHHHCLETQAQYNVSIFHASRSYRYLVKPQCAVYISHEKKGDVSYELFGWPTKGKHRADVDVTV